jgi:hypothetical protein
MPRYFASPPQETRTRNSRLQCSSLRARQRDESPWITRTEPLPTICDAGVRGVVLQNSRSKQNAHRVPIIPGSLHRVRCHEQFPNPIHKLAVGILIKLLLRPDRNIFAILHGRPPGCEMSFGSLSPFPSEHHKRNSPIIAMCDNAAAKSPRKVIVALGKPVPCAQVFLRFSRTFFFRKSITPGWFQRLLCTPECQ